MSEPKPLSESLQDDSKPDRYTIAWWREQLQEIAKQLRGATAGINRCWAEYADCYKAIEKMKSQCEAFEKRQTEADAEIARLREATANVALLREEVKALSERMDKLVPWTKKKFEELEKGQ